MQSKDYEQFLIEAFDELEAAEAEMADLEDEEDDYFFEPLSKDRAILVEYDGEDAVAVVPAQIGGFTVTAIDAGAFFMKEHLRCIILPDTVEDIHDFAIQECGSLERLVLPQNLRAFGEMAVSGTPALKELELPAECEKYVLRDGILFSRDGESLIFCPPACGLTEYTVPKGVRHVEPQAFDNCRSLRRVSLPAGLRTIGEMAFSDTGLTAIDLPDSLTSLGKYAFSACGELRRVSLGEDLWRIDGSCFAGCPALEEMTLHPLNPALRLQDGFLMDESSTVLLYAVPGQMTGQVRLPRTVRELGEHAFDSCTAMTGLLLHEHVEGMGSYAFADCTALKKIRIPEKVRELSFLLFMGCEALEEVLLHDGVCMINQFAFTDCTSLKQLQLHRHILIDTSDGETVFYHCPARIELLP